MFDAGTERECQMNNTECHPLRIRDTQVTSTTWPQSRTMRCASASAAIC
jgi:hypothetical protein